VAADGSEKGSKGAGDQFWDVHEAMESSMGPTWEKMNGVVHVDVGTVTMHEAVLNWLENQREERFNCDRRFGFEDSYKLWVHRW